MTAWQEAAGRYDAFFEIGLMPWDVAAGSLLGALTYPAFVTGLWWLAGKPDSVERLLLGRLLEVLRPRLRRAG